MQSTKPSYEALLDEIKTLKESIDHFGEGYIKLDRELNYLYVNKKAAAISSFKAEELIGRNLQELESGLEEEELINFFKMALGSGRELYFDHFNSKHQCWFNYKVLPSDEGLVVVIHEKTDFEFGQKALEQSEKKIRTVLDGLPEGIIVAEQESGSFVYANSTFCNMLGYEIEEVLKLGVPDLHPIEDLPMIMEEFQLMMRGESKVARNFRVKRKSGEIFFADIFAVPMKLDDKECVCGIFNDITDKLIAEETISFTKKKIKENTVILKQAQKIAQMGYWQFDLQTNELHWSDEIFEIFGRKPQEFTATLEGFMEFVHIEDRNMVSDAYSNHLKTKQDYNIVHRIVTSNNEIKYVNERCHTEFDEHDNPIRSLGVVADITDIRKVETEAKENEFRYKVLVESSPIGKIVTDKSDTTILINKRFTDITGYTKDDIKSVDDWWQKAYPEKKYREVIREKWNKEINSANSKGNGFQGIEVKIQCKDGSWKYLEVGFISLAESSLMTFVDVTERKQIEESLREQGTRMDQLSTHSKTVSWEVDQNGLFTYLSHVSEIVMGYHPDELVGKKHFYDLHPQKGREEFKNQALAVFDQKLEFSDLPNQIQHKDGKIIWVSTNGIPMVNDQGELIGYRGSDTDITIRKNAETALIESESENRRLFETMAQGVVYQDKNGAIFKANPAAERMLGLSFEQMIGYKSTDPRWHAIHENGDVFPGEYHPAMVALNTGVPVKDVVMGVFIPEKDIYTWILVNAEPEFKENEDKPYQVFTTFTDITEQKRITESLKKQTLYLELIAEIAKRYINIPLHNLDYEINESLQLIGDFVKADRAYIFNYDLEQNTVSNSYEWVSNKEYSQIESFRAVPAHLFKRGLKKHQQGLPSIIASVEELESTGEEGELKAALTSLHVKSLVTTPVIEKGRLIGFIGFDFIRTQRTSFEIEEKLLFLFSQLLLNVKNRKEADDTLKENSRFLKDVIDNSGSIIYVKDKEGKYLTVNSKWTEMIGLSEKETLGRFDHDFFPKNIADEFRKNDLLVMEKGELLVYEENFEKKGQLRYFLSHKFPLRNKDGDIIGSCGNSTEITALKNVQFALNESEANLKALLSSSLDSIWSIDKNYNIIYTNDRFAEEFELAYGKRLSKGTNLLEALPDELSTVWKKRYDAVFKNERIRFTERFQFDNRTLVFDIVMNPIVIEDKVMAVSVFTKDISEQELAKESLKISEENFRQIAENVSEIFWLRNAENTEMIYVNPAFQTTFGVSVETLYRDPNAFINSIIEEDRPRIIEALQIYNQNGEFDNDYRIMRPNGEIRWMNARSMPVRNEKNVITGHAGVAMDITDMKNYELEILDKNKQLNLVIQNIPGAVFSCYRETQCHMLFISDFIEQISGYSSKDICDGHLICYTDLIHPDDIRKLRKAMEKGFEQRQRYTHTYRINHRDGSIRWVYEIGEFQHYDGEMEQKRIDGIIFDITKSITEEEEKLTAIFQATDAERTRISLEIHDGLQQTLVASKLNLELLKKEIEHLEPKLQERYQTGLKFLEVAIQEGRSIARSLLPKHVSDFGYVMAVENMLENLDKKKMEFKFYHHDIMLNDDKYGHNLYRITQEAINNILKHAHATKVHINLTHEESRLILTIEDNGKGFKNDEASGKKDKTIGLQSMKSRATAIGANFEIFSNPGKGTLIVIDMPYDLAIEKSKGE